MAKQHGTINFTGKVGNLVYYKTQDGYFVRQRGGASKETQLKSPYYENIRKQNEEFTAAARAVKLFREAFPLPVKTWGDKTLTNRLMSLMMKLVQSDKINPKGSRKPENGNLDLLSGFCLSKKGKKDLVYMRKDWKQENGFHTLIVKDYFCRVSPPGGATHLRFFLCGANLPFTGGEHLTKCAKSKFLILGKAEEEVEIKLRLPDSFDAYVLGLVFYQKGYHGYYALGGETTKCAYVVKVK